jgi:large repetitive protein
MLGRQGNSRPTAGNGEVPRGVAPEMARGRAPAHTETGTERDTGRTVVRLLVAAACVLATLAALTLSNPQVASAATLDAVATIASPGTSDYLASGGSATPFTVSLPAQAACSGDTATDGYHVFSYLVEKGTNVTTITFPDNLPNSGDNQYGLVEADAAYWGDKNTAPTTGQVIDIPNDFEFGPLLSDGVTLDNLLYQDTNTSGVWEAGFACTNNSGVVTDYWNTEVTFTASGSDPDGFVWSGIPGPSGSQISNITSMNTATFTEGVDGSFTPTATGTPTPTITQQGTLPTGVGFSGGALSGTPTQSGSFPITFTATNGIGNPDVQDFTLTVNAAAGAPTVTGVAPGSGPPAGGTSVGVTGTNFTGATAVHFGTVAGTGLVVNSATSISITSPAGTSGTTVNVTVTTPAGTSAINPSDDFTYGSVPSVASISSDAGVPAGGTPVSVTGTNFTGATAVNFGATAGTGLVVNSATSISITSPAGTSGTTVDVTVVGPDGTSALTPADKFTYEGDPTVTGVSPNTGPTTGATPVTVTGTNFTDASVVDFGTTAGTGLVVNSATSISITSPAGTAGTIDVTVTTPLATSATSAADEFTYVAPPTVTNVNPGVGPAAGGTPVALTGTNFTGATAVHFGTVAGTGLVVNSATSISITSPAGSGTVNVTVTTPDGGTSATSDADQFVYQVAPRITSANATTFIKGSPGSFTVTATGNPAPTITQSAGTLPAGVSFVGNQLSGTPTVTGSFPITFTASNGVAPDATQSFTLNVILPPLQISTTSLPGGTVGVAYTANLTATGGVPPYTWSVSTGSLPAGLSLNAATGAITGTPSSPTSASFGVTVTDTQPVQTVATLSIVVSVANTGSGTFPAPTVGIAALPNGDGYWVADSAGDVANHGAAANYGSLTGLPLNAPIVHIVATPNGQGYWLVGADGGVFAFGDAPFYGSMASVHLNAPVVDIAPTNDGQGYWLIAADGGVFAFGDAGFQGSMGGVHLNAPVVGGAADSATGGYWLVAADGGVFSFDAPFFGSTGSLVLSKPVNGMAIAPNGNGYWLVASDGGVFAFNAPFAGSAVGIPGAAPIVGIGTSGSSGGYWLVGAGGGVYSFGAPFYGSG